MTVNAIDITSGPYPGNGVADSFSYDFRIENKNQLYVWETDDEGTQTLLTVDTDYTVSGVGDDAGGTVTRVAGALPSGYELYIRSNYDPTQNTNFSSQGGFFPWVHEEAFDKLTYLIQQLDDQVKRSLRTGISNPLGSGSFELPSLAADRANKLLKFNSDGDAEVVSAIDNLQSSNATTPLSANQGRILRELIQSIDPDGAAVTDIVTYFPDITSVPFINATDQKVFAMNSWRPGGGQGGGIFVYKEDEPKENHDGGSILSLTVPTPVSFSNAGILGYIDGVGETDPTGTGCLVRLIDNGSITVEQYGVLPDGVTDCTSVLQKIIDTVGGKYDITFESRSGYVVNDTINITTSGTRVIGNGTEINATDFRVGQTSVDAVLFNVYGTEDDPVALAQNVEKGSKTITLTDVSSLAIDDLILLYSNEPFADGATGGNLRGELCWIQDVDGSTDVVTLHNHTHFSFNASNGGAIRKQNPVADVVFQDLDITMGGLEKAHVGMNFDHTTFPIVKDCKLRRCESRGVGMRWTYGGVVRGCLITDVTSPGESGGPATANAGYGVVVGAASRDCQILDNFFRHCRDATSGGGLFATGPCLVRGNHTVNAQFDCHEDCYLWTFDNNISTGDRAGFLMRGQSTTVTNNTVIGSISGQFAGIYIRPYGVDNPGGHRGCIVQGNRLYNTYSAAISLDGDQGTEIIDAIVSDNYIEDSGVVPTNSINIYRVKGATIANNIVKNSGQAAMRIRAGCEDISVSGGVYHGKPNFDTILIEDCTNVSLDNVTVLKGDNCVKVERTTGVKVTDCTLSPGKEKAFNKALFLEECTQIQISSVSGIGPDDPENSAVLVRLADGCTRAVVNACSGSSWGKLVSTSGVGNDFITVTSCDTGGASIAPQIDLIDVPNKFVWGLGSSSTSNLPNKVYTETSTSYSTTTEDFWISVANLDTTISAISGSKRQITANLNLYMSYDGPSDSTVNVDIDLMRDGVSIKQFTAIAGTRFYSGSVTTLTWNTPVNYVDGDNVSGNVTYRLRFRQNRSGSASTAAVNVVAGRTSSLLVENIA